MMAGKKWQVITTAKNKKTLITTEDIINILLEQRGIKTENEKKLFLTPHLEDVTSESVGIDKKHLVSTLKRIQKAIEKKEKIIVFGDYDVDGITGTAILWETLYSLGANVLPYIPHRIDEGYGLSIKGIEHLLQEDQNIKLIITVDNGIVAHKPVTFANAKGIDVIITDHHVPSAELPDAFSIVHTTKLCGAGVAYLLSQEMLSSEKEKKVTNLFSHLDLVALATIADLVPLTGANRTLVTFGLRALQKSKRIGLLRLFDEAQIEQADIDVYTIGHMIAPRLNAMGRLESAMESLRLLCTLDINRAQILAQKLGTTNRERQLLTISMAEHALTEVRNNTSKTNNLLFIAHESYEQGVIGLVAGKLVEEFYRPSIVIAKGEKYSKASARSISGFNIIEFIRLASDLLVDAGGHPMAAGFTVETDKITALQTFLEELAEKMVTKDHLTRILRIDYELPLEKVTQELYKAIQKLSPFGMGNPEPTFVSTNVTLSEIKTVGKEGKHLKVKIEAKSGNYKIEGIGFGLGEKMDELYTQDAIDIVYTIDENVWNGNTRLQLKLKDIRSSLL